MTLAELLFKVTALSLWFRSGASCGVTRVPLVGGARTQARVDLVEQKVLLPSTGPQAPGW